MIVKKYIFNDEQKVNDLINQLGDEINANVVKLGNIILNDSEFDEQGNEIKAPIFSDKYHVDVCWNDKNDSNISIWSKHEIILDNEGVHSFFGLKYISD